MWQAFHDEIQRWHAADRQPRLWLRDDDAIAPSPALDRLTALAEKHRATVLLAVIPRGAGADLARHVAAHPLLHPCQHGFAHANHAPAGEKKQELGPHRALADVADELAAGRAKLLDLFGDALRPVLVPPWNRIDAALLSQLPAIGLHGLSVFGKPAQPAGGRLDSNVDIMDWHGTRGGLATAALVPLLVRALETARNNGGAPVGILTHHLVHDEEAWTFLEALFAQTGECRWVSFDTLALQKSAA